MSQKNKESIQARTTKLDEMVAWFDGDDFELEQAVEKFKEAEKLAAEIEHDLMNLNNTITVVKERFDRAE